MPLAAAIALLKSSRIVRYSGAKAFARDCAQQKNPGVAGRCGGRFRAGTIGVSRPHHLYDDNFDGVLE